MLSFLTKIVTASNRNATAAFLLHRTSPNKSFEWHCLLRLRAGAQREGGAARSDGRIDLERIGTPRDRGGSLLFVNVQLVREGGELENGAVIAPGRIDTHRAGMRRPGDTAGVLAASESAAAKKRANVRALREASLAS